jgi:hypothetical protein
MRSVIAQWRQSLNPTNEKAHAYRRPRRGQHGGCVVQTGEAREASLRAKSTAKATLSLIDSHTIAKGMFWRRRGCGIVAAKKTGELIPLCIRC